MERVILCTYYTDIFKNGTEEIRKIAEFLEVPAASNPELIEAINNQCQFDVMKTEKQYAPDLANKVFIDPSKFNIYRKGLFVSLLISA